MTRRVALLAFATVLAAAAILVGSGTPFGSGATDTPAPWRLLPRAPLTFDAGQTSVWTGTELIVSGLTGAGADGNLLDSTEAALAYNPAARSWRRLAAPPRTDTYCRRDAVWTGREMLVWGCSLLAYDPAADHWRRLPEPPSGAGIVVWTGREMLGWGGGCCGDATARGEAFDPGTETWRTIADSPLAPEQQPLGVWTGRELVLFVSGISAVDGKPLPPELARAAAYEPATDAWRRIAPLPESGVGATAVWSGREILVVGGRDRNGALARAGLAYNPTTADWRRFPAMEPGRIGAVTAWTGSRLLVWGGDVGRTALAPVRGGLSFDPAGDRWTPLPRSPLEARTDAIAAWTGRELIVWGGVGAGDRGNGRRLDDGAAFAPRPVTRNP
jgi:hypothetical protein